MDSATISSWVRAVAKFQFNGLPLSFLEGISCWRRPRLPQKSVSWLDRQIRYISLFGRFYGILFWERFWRELTMWRRFKRSHIRLREFLGESKANTWLTWQVAWTLRWTGVGFSQQLCRCHKKPFCPFRRSSSAAVIKSLSDPLMICGNRQYNQLPTGATPCVEGFSALCCFTIFIFLPVAWTCPFCSVTSNPSLINGEKRADQTKLWLTSGTFCFTLKNHQRAKSTWVCKRLPPFLHLSSLRRGVGLRWLW